MFRYHILCQDNAFALLSQFLYHLDTRRPQSCVDGPSVCYVVDLLRVGVNDRAIPPHRRVFVRARAGELLLVEVLEEVFGAGVVISKL